MVTHDLSGAGEVKAGCVFAGYGITAPEQQWNDYKDADLTGKVLLVMNTLSGEEFTYGDRNYTGYSVNNVGMLAATWKEVMRESSTA